MKLLSKRSVALTSILLLTIVYFYQSRVEQRELELKIQRFEIRAQEYEEKFKSCVPTSIIYQAGYSSDPRTSKRLTEVVSIFNQIADASCFSSLQGSMLSNPYNEIRLGELGRREHSPLEEEVYQGFLYEYDKGVPFLRSGWTLCEDGSLSGSAGRGTCSWHGGYAKQRGETFNFDFAEKIPNPRDKIAQLLDQ